MMKTLFHCNLKPRTFYVFSFCKPYFTYFLHTFKHSHKHASSTIDSLKRMKDECHNWTTCNSWGLQQLTTPFGVQRRRLSSYSTSNIYNAINLCVTHAQSGYLCGIPVSKRNTYMYRVRTVLCLVLQNLQEKPIPRLEYVMLRRSLHQYQLHITGASLRCERCTLSTDSIKIFFSFLVALFQAFSANQTRPVNLWAITKDIMAVQYRRFGTNCRFHIQGSIILHSCRLGRQVVAKRR